MAPLENTGVAETRPIDSLMRTLLYVAQQIGRPVSEADVRRLAALQSVPGRLKMRTGGACPIGTSGRREGGVELPDALQCSSTQDKPKS